MKKGNFVLAVLLLVSTVLAVGRQQVQAATIKLTNPVITEENGEKKVTYDYIWFGSYPQTEVVDKKTGAEYPYLDQKYLSLMDNTVIADDNIYNKLKNADGWDENGDIIIGNEKYRRIKYSDATTHYKARQIRYYDWQGDKTSYHYFKYEPIKWRVLSVDDKKNQALLLSEALLDCKKYNEKQETVTWDTSTIRSWLNGYDASANDCGVDYRTGNFIDIAFAESEKEVISKTKVDGTSSKDQIFLLSVSQAVEVAKAKTGNYGWENQLDTVYGRGSYYGIAMGLLLSATSINRGYSVWWLSTVDAEEEETQANVSLEVYLKGPAYVSWGGDIIDDSLYFTSPNGVRPALTLDLAAYNKLNSDGSTGTENTKRKTNKITTQKKTFTITASQKAQTLTIQAYPKGGTLSFLSSKKSVKVNKSGQVTIKKNFSGIAKITIKASGGGYKTARKTVTIKVKPYKTTGVAVQSKKAKQLTVSWKKNTTAGGYEVQYSTGKNFKEKTTGSVKTTKNEVAIKKLKSGKKYYVRVRAYKKVTVNGTSQLLYSKWSTVKSKTIKKG